MRKNENDEGISTLKGEICEKSEGLQQHRLDYFTSTST